MINKLHLDVGIVFEDFRRFYQKLFSPTIALRLSDLVFVADIGYQPTFQIPATLQAPWS
jgi:hypothetical protein